MTDFTNKWSPPYKTSTSDKVSDALNPQGPLKPRLGEGTRLLATQKKRLDAIISKMEYRDKKLLGEIATTKQSGNMYQARTLATELIQVRKTQQMLVNLRSMITMTENRFMTYDGIGDVAVTIEPIIALMKNLKSSLGKFLPTTAGELNQMTEVLGNYLTQTQNSIVFNNEVNSMNADVESVMSEAAAVASDSVNAKLPSTPTEVGQATTTNNTI